MVTGGAGSVDAAANDPNTVTITMGSFSVPPNQEVFMCQDFDNPFGGVDVAVGKSESDMTPGSHHLHVFYGEDSPASPTVSACANPFEFRSLLHVAGQPHLVTQYPAGMAAKLKGSVGLRLQAHYLNTTSSAYTANVVVRLTKVDPSTMTKWVAQLYFNRTVLSVPEGDGQTVTTTCTVPSTYGQISLISGASHMHSRGVHFVANTSTGVNLVDTTKWDEPPIPTYDPPITLNPGDSITWTCTYNNMTGGTLTFGDSATEERDVHLSRSLLLGAERRRHRVPVTVAERNGHGDEQRAVRATSSNERAEPERTRRHCAVQPPSTTIVCPVMLRAAGEARKFAMPASSSIPTNTPLGMGCSMTFCHHLGFGDPAGPRLLGDLLVDERRLHVARADRVDRDVGVRGLERDHLGEPDQAVLCGDVRALERTPDQGVNAPDVDDAPRAALAHPGQDRARQPRDADEHHLDEEGPVADRKLLQRSDPLQTGVVDQDVDRLREPPHRGGDALVRGHVQRDRLRRAAGRADRRRDGLRLVEVNVTHDDVPAGSGQLDRESSADSAGRTCDESGAHESLTR